MNMNIEKITIPVGSNPITLETGKLAKLADGAVQVQSGETVLLVTAVSQTKIREGQTWFPLSVEYKERAAAAGVSPVATSSAKDVLLRRKFSPAA